MVVTVIMTVFNREKTVGRAIKSILGQSIKDIELIIVNDGSNDSSPEIIRSFSDKRIKFIDREKNKGIPYSLNQAAEMASGKYIARMDSDDYSSYDRLEKQATILDNDPHIGYVSTFATIRSQNNKIIKHVDQITNPERARKAILTGHCYFGASMMIRHTTMKKLNYYDEQYSVAQDYDLALRASEICQLTAVPEYLYHITFFPDGISRGKKEIQSQICSQLSRNALEKNLEKDRLKFNEFHKESFPNENKLYSKVCYTLGRYYLSKGFYKLAKKEFRVSIKNNSLFLKPYLFLFIPIRILKKIIHINYF